MESLGETVLASQEKPFTASTDMGNVSYELPSMHGAFVIPTTLDTALHSTKFAAAAGTMEAHNAAVKSGKGMAILAWRLLADDSLVSQMQHDFDNTKF